MLFTEFDEKQWEAEIRREAMAEGKKSVTQIFIEDKLDDHASDEDILYRLLHRFQLSEEQATALLSEVKATYKPLA